MPPAPPPPYDPYGGYPVPPVPMPAPAPVPAPSSYVPIQVMLQLLDFVVFNLRETFCTICTINFEDCSTLCYELMRVMDDKALAFEGLNHQSWMLPLCIRNILLIGESLFFLYYPFLLFFCFYHLCGWL